MVHGPNVPVMTMHIEFEKRADGDTVMRCTRADGTTVGQRHPGARGVFFAYHDLTHLAVEGTLGRRDGFFGLLAEGWDVADTEGRGTRGVVPAGAIEVENLVGLFDRERAGSVEWTADEFNEAAAAYAHMHGHPAPTRLTDEQIVAIRAEVRALHDEWRSTPAGSVMRVELHG